MQPQTKPRDNRPVLTVSELNRQARVTIEERFNMVWVTGELSNFVRPRSGHWYFTLKDDRAQVRCAMFVNRNRYARLQPSDGQQVVVRGRVSLYEGRGEFQIIVEQIEPAGEGALRQAFDALKLKLDAEGLFALERKRDLPRFPRHVAVISSATGAAVHDVLAVLQRRFPALRVTLIPTAVQGAEAEPELLYALARLGELDPDVAILTRGGGSLEDLWAFNLESVARAVAAAPVPVISAVGHEIDVTIVDFVADVRAPTPSAAAELTVPGRAELLEVIAAYERDFAAAWGRLREVNELKTRSLALRLVSPQRAIEQAYQRTDDAARRMQNATQRMLAERRERVSNLATQLRLTGPRRRLGDASARVQQAYARMAAAWQRGLEQKHAALTAGARMLSGVSPLPTLRRGYAVIKNAADETVIGTIGQVRRGQKITAQLADGAFTAAIEAVDTDARLEEPNV